MEMGYSIWIICCPHSLSYVGLVLIYQEHIFACLKCSDSDLATVTQLSTDVTWILVYINRLKHWQIFIAYDFFQRLLFLTYIPLLPNSLSDSGSVDEKVYNHLFAIGIMYFVDVCLWLIWPVLFLHFSCKICMFFFPSFPLFCSPLIVLQMCCIYIQGNPHCCAFCNCQHRGLLLSNMISDFCLQLSPTLHSL